MKKYYAVHNGDSDDRENMWELIYQHREIWTLVAESLTQKEADNYALTLNKIQVEELKMNWSKDPNWDIEDTEGFEDYYEELKSFRERKSAEWEIGEQQWINERSI